MLKTLTFIRHHAIALVALFVALAGTSYAAFRLPRDSVGTSQIRNHAVTPVKLDPRYIGAEIRYWAEVAPSGRVVASNVPAHTVNWTAGLANLAGELVFTRSIPVRRCVGTATVTAIPGNAAAPGGFATVVAMGGNARGSSDLQISTFAPQGARMALPVFVAVNCW